MLDKLKIKANKSSIITIVIIVGLISIYWLLRGEAEPIIPLDEPQEQIVGQKLLVELGKLRALREVNFEKFLADPILNSLKDTEVKPVPLPIGRNNPFTLPDSEI